MLSIKVCIKCQGEQCTLKQFEQGGIIIDYVY